MPILASRLDDKRKREHKRCKARRRLRVETLEDRRLLAVLAADGFEAGNFAGGSEQWATGNWDASGDATVRGDISPATGSNHARLRRSTGDLQRTVDVTYFSDIRLQFDAKLFSLEGSDRADVKISGDGSTWTTLLTFSNGDDDGQYKSYDLVVPDVGNTLHVRFDANMSGSADYWFIDNVKVVGTPSGPVEITIGDATVTEGDATLKNLGVFVSEGSGGLIRPRTNIFGPDRNNDSVEELYVISADTDEILVYDGATGEFLEPFITGVPELENSADIAFGDGFFFANSAFDLSKIFRFDANTGVYIDSLDVGTEGPLGITLAENGPYTGDLFLTDRFTNEVLRYDFDTQTSTPFVSAGSGGIVSPWKAVIGPDNDLYVTSQGTNQVLKYDGLTGEFLKVVAADVMASAIWLAFDEAGSLYLTGSLASGPVGAGLVRIDVNTGSVSEILELDQGGSNGLNLGPNDLFYVSGNAGGNQVRLAGPASTAVFEVTLSQAYHLPITVDYTIADDTAVAGSDYISTSGTLLFEPGVTTRTIVVPTIDDTEVEEPETFTVTLSNPTSGAELAADHVGEGTIIDDDVSREITITDAVAGEADTELTIIDRFVNDGSGGLRRARMSTFGPDANGDGKDDLYVASVDTNQILVYDGISGAFILPFADVLDPFDLQFSPVDGNLYVSSLSGKEVVRFDGQTGELLDTPIGNLADGPRGLTFADDGTLYITLGSANEVLKYDGSSLTTFISAGTSGLNRPRKAVFGPDGHMYVNSNGSESNGNAKQVLRFDGADGSFLGAVTTLDLSSALIVDFDSQGVLYVSGRDTQTCCNTSIARVDITTGAVLDTYVLGRDGWSFQVGPDDIIYSSSNDIVLGSFVDRIGPQSIALFDVQISTPSEIPVTVDFATTGIDAIDGIDYVSTSGTLIFEPGVTTRTIVVPVIDDSEVEDYEFFNVSLSNPVGAVIPDPTPAIGGIVDDDTSNLSPLADAGEDQTLRDADGNNTEEVTLAGDVFDPDGFVTSVQWTLDGEVLGSSLDLETTLPVGVHEIVLTATDDKGATGSDTVVITVQANEGPAADAGDDQIVTDSDDSGSETVTLVGTGSDPDGNIVGYEWKIGDDTLGSAATLETSLPVGTHTLTLIVTDNGGATASDTVVVTVNPAPSEVVLFEDSFEVGSNNNDWNGKWVEDEQNDFFRSPQRSTDGLRSAEVDGWAYNATLTMATPIDLTGYTSTTLTFDWLIEKGFDRGEYLSLDVSADGGSSWYYDVRRLSGNVDAENEWHSESVDLSSVNSSNLLIRFRSYVSSSREDANIDNVKISGYAIGGDGGSFAASFAASAGNQTDEATLVPLGGSQPTASADSFVDTFDVNQDGAVTPLDALRIINWLNLPQQDSAPTSFDINEDGKVSPLDALLIINRLNQVAIAEGESAGPTRELSAEQADDFFGAMEEDLFSQVSLEI